MHTLPITSMRHPNVCVYSAYDGHCATQLSFSPNSLSCRGSDGLGKGGGAAPWAPACWWRAHFLCAGAVNGDFGLVASTRNGRLFHFGCFLQYKMSLRGPDRPRVSLRPPCPPEISQRPARRAQRPPRRAWRIAQELREPLRLRIGSGQSTCPSSQHSTCLASQQGRCLGSQEGTCLASQH